MELNKKAAYLQGLVDGLGIDDTTKEGKIIKAMSALLGEMAEVIESVDEDLSRAYDQILSLIHIFVQPPATPESSANCAAFWKRRATRWSARRSWASPSSRRRPAPPLPRMPSSRPRLSAGPAACPPSPMTPACAWMRWAVRPASTVPATAAVSYTHLPGL